MQTAQALIKMLRNDTLTTTLSVLNAAAFPAAQNFETGTFPHSPWSVFNPDGDITWQPASVGRTSTKSLFIDNYSTDNSGKIDEYRSPALSVLNPDSVVISFYVAHKPYPGSNDSLIVLISTDCGNSFAYTSYRKAGLLLATAGVSTSNYVTPAAIDWRLERITLPGTLFTSGSVIVAFRNKNDYGNNIFIDDININKYHNIYTFNGNGNWNDENNWVNKAIPPATLAATNEVIINPSGNCVVNIPVTLTGGKFTVKTGKNLVTQGNLTLQ